MLTQGPAVMIGRPPPPAAPRFRSVCGPDVPLRSGWSGHCLQILERVLPTLHARKTQDKCQSRPDRGALDGAGDGEKISCEDTDGLRGNSLSAGPAAS
jgi:hypothetical protein